MEFQRDLLKFLIKPRNELYINVVVVVVVGSIAGNACLDSGNIIHFFSFSYIDTIY